jgi:excisionase family DNA binding protein
MSSRKNVLTTGEVARICNVAPRTVSKWFDSGQLNGYRIPGSKDRRIPLHHLVRFMRAFGIPMNGLDTGCRRLLVLDDDQQFCDALRGTLEAQEQFEVTAAASAFEAGARIGDTRPHVLLVDVHRRDVKPDELSRFIQSSAELRQTCLIGTGLGLTPAEGQELLQAGFNAYLAKPFQVPALLELIERNAAADGNGNGVADANGRDATNPH